MEEALTDDGVGDEIPLLLLDNLLNRRVNNPVEGTRVISVKLILERNTLLVNVDGLAHRHGVDELPGYLGLVLLPGQFGALVVGAQRAGFTTVQMFDEGRTCGRTGDRG